MPETMETVDFTQMKDGTRADYKLLARHEETYRQGTSDRLLRELASRDKDSLSGYKITRLQHGLQTATRARRHCADIDWVVAALLHDIGDGLAPQNHDKVAAEILRPYMREEVVWTVRHHGIFQMVYYAHHYGWEPELRQTYADSPYFRSCVDFCERWDQASFDPDYPTDPLTSFEAEVHEVFARKAFDPDVVQAGRGQGIAPIGIGLSGVHCPPLPAHGVVGMDRYLPRLGADRSSAFIAFTTSKAIGRLSIVAVRCGIEVLQLVALGQPQGVPLSRLTHSRARHSAGQGVDAFRAPR